MQSCSLSLLLLLFYIVPLFVTADEFKCKQLNDVVNRKTISNPTVKMERGCVWRGQTLLKANNVAYLELDITRMSQQAPVKGAYVSIEETIFTDVELRLSALSRDVKDVKPFYFIMRDSSINNMLSVLDVDVAGNGKAAIRFSGVFPRRSNITLYGNVLSLKTSGGLAPALALSAVVLVSQTFKLVENTELVFKDNDLSVEPDPKSETYAYIVAVPDTASVTITGGSILLFSRNTITAVGSNSSQLWKQDAAPFTLTDNGTFSFNNNIIHITNIIPISMKTMTIGGGMTVEDSNWLIRYNTFEIDYNNDNNYNYNNNNDDNENKTSSFTLIHFPYTEDRKLAFKRNAKVKIEHNIFTINKTTQFSYMWYAEKGYEKHREDQTLSSSFKITFCNNTNNTVLVTDYKTDYVLPTTLFGENVHTCVLDDAVKIAIAFIVLIAILLPLLALCGVVAFIYYCFCRKGQYHEGERLMSSVNV